jgi:DNA-binding protein YbaB
MDRDPSYFDEQIEEAMADYRQQLQNAAESAEKMSAVTASATDPRRTVTVTVNAQRTVSALEFPTSRYKELPPKELATIIVDTIKEAVADVGAQANEFMRAGLPDFMDPTALANGTIDFTKLMPAEAPLSRMVEEFLGRPMPTMPKKEH